MTRKRATWIAIKLEAGRWQSRHCQSDARFVAGPWRTRGFPETPPTTASGCSSAGSSLSDFAMQQGIVVGRGRGPGVRHPACRRRGIALLHRSPCSHDSRSSVVAQSRSSRSFFFNPGCWLESGLETPGLQLPTFNPPSVLTEGSL